MKKKFKMQDLECAHCAAKMEDAISRIEGVDEVSISFLTQKMTLVADDAVFEDVLSKAVKEISRIEPDCKVLA